MATLLSTLRTSARLHLIETTADFWTEAELLDIMLQGVKDLWGAIADLHQEHFLTVDITSVSLSASTGSLSGVPSDTFRVHIIEPTNTIDGSYRDLIFIPREYNSPDFIAARSLAAQSPTEGQVLYYCVTNAGAPVAAPTVLIAPTVTAAIAAGGIRFVYVPTLGALTASSNNPIPGESDHALIAWTVAYARAKETESRVPDTGWLSVYATEKQHILARLAPRQVQEPEYAEALFESLW